VDGIEATRERQSWEKHLLSDLEKAGNPKYPNLSGYFFVGGYPDHAPTSKEIREWSDRIASQFAIESATVSILIGDDLVQELVQPQYARIRQEILRIPAQAQFFRLLGAVGLFDGNLGAFQPTREEFDRGQVTPPALMSAVLSDLKVSGHCRVTGYGAAGKTTLAQLVAASESFNLNPSWYLDIARFEPQELDASLNEMIHLTAEGVLFVIDNGHLDEGFAQRAHACWEKLSKPLHSKLLLLGRQTSEARPGKSTSSPNRLLRAGFAEMISVATRLWARKKQRVPQLSPETLADWAYTFGGSRKPDETAVDLIAFAAALEQQIDRLFRGDFTLRAEDAVDGVQARYLRPLTGTGELANLFRLAALAGFEIGLPDELLVDPVAAFHESKRRLGIVIEERTGLERRRRHKLVHAALGDLLIKANGNFDAASERIAIARASPATGVRMLAEDRGASDIADVIRTAIVDGDWVKCVHNIYDMSTVIRAGLHKRWADSATLDQHLVRNDDIQRITEGTRDLPGIAAFVGLSIQRNLVLSRTAILALAKARHSRLATTLLASNVREAVRLMRELPGGAQILPTIELRAWSTAQANVPPDAAAEIVAATRFLELHGRADLAVEPCAQLVRSRDPGLWNPYADLSHLSHAIRRSRCASPEIGGLVRFLSGHQWMQKAVGRSGVGQLCGALMSLANNLPEDLRPHILVDELGDRVTRTLQGIQSQAAKQAARTVCLVGAYSSLGGRLPASLPFNWSQVVSIPEMLARIVPKKDEGIVGMYELQFWLGLMALHELNFVAKDIAPASQDRFALILRKSEPPTQQGTAIKQRLLMWLDRLNKSGSSTSDRPNG